MADITIYHKPTCTTCRQASSTAEGERHTLHRRQLLRTIVHQVPAQEAAQKGRTLPRDVLRTKEEIYQESGTSKKQLSDDELLDLMVQYPDLIQRRNRRK